MENGMISFSVHKRNNQIYMNLILIFNFFQTIIIEQFVLIYMYAISKSDQQGYLTLTHTVGHNIYLHT